MSIELQVAIVAALSAFLAAVGPALLQRRSTRRARDAIGEKNGHGSLIEMATELLHLSTTQGEHNERVERRMERLESKSDSHTDRLYGRMGRLEDKADRLHADHAELRRIVEKKEES